MLRVFCLWALLGTFPMFAFAPPENLREKHVPVSRKPSHRLTQYSLISGDTFRAFCNHVFDETTKDFEPSKVKQGDTIFVGKPYLKHFFQNVMPFIVHKFIVVTSNGEGVIDESFLPYLEKDQLVACFSTNVMLKNPHPKVHCVPIGICWFAPLKKRGLIQSYFNQLSLQSFFEKKPIYSYLNISVTTYPARQDLLDAMVNKPFCYISQRIEFSLYMQHLSKAVFVFSPRGDHLDCYRTWETLYAGSIPIVESSDLDVLYKDLPVIIVEDLKEVTPSFLDQGLEKLRSQKIRLEKLNARYWLGLIGEQQRLAK